MTVSCLLRYWPSMGPTIKPRMTQEGQWRPRKAKEGCEGQGRPREASSVQWPRMEPTIKLFEACRKFFGVILGEFKRKYKGILRASPPNNCLLVPLESPQDFPEDVLESIQKLDCWSHHEPLMMKLVNIDDETQEEPFPWLSLPPFLPPSLPPSSLPKAP